MKYLSCQSYPLDLPDQELSLDHPASFCSRRWGAFSLLVFLCEVVKLYQKAAGRKDETGKEASLWIQ
jgi:hypothetical protein